MKRGAFPARLDDALIVTAMLVAALLVTATTASAQPSRLIHAQVTTHALTPGALGHELAPSPAREPHWLAYAVPAVSKGHVCCFENLNGKGDSELRNSGCRLESEGSFTFGSGADRTLTNAMLDGRSQLLVFYRMEKGALTNVRVFSGDCGIDAEGRPVTWLTGVTPEESVTFLGGLVTAPAHRARKALVKRRGGHKDEVPAGFDDDGPGEHALTALALHAGPAAQKALEGFIGKGQPQALRAKAAFWIGNERGREGFEALKRIVPEDESAAFRQEATFAISQCEVPEATDLLLRMAKRDPEGDVRGQALFWLAQKAGKKAADGIVDAIHDDPDVDVKEKAVFALTQLPDGQGVPELIRLARTHRTPEVREKALFWLGQSGDPRALEFIEEILTK
ncbi:MAG: HEAT repeat domain-containing protein [Thermoanaerobaculia bacterium]